MNKNKTLNDKQQAIRKKTLDTMKEYAIPEEDKEFFDDHLDKLFSKKSDNIWLKLFTLTNKKINDELFIKLKSLIPYDSPNSRTLIEECINQIGEKKQEFSTSTLKKELHLHEQQIPDEIKSILEQLKKTEDALRDETSFFLEEYIFTIIKSINSSYSVRLSQSQGDIKDAKKKLISNIKGLKEEISTLHLNETSFSLHTNKTTNTITSKFTLQKNSYQIPLTTFLEHTEEALINEINDFLKNRLIGKTDKTKAKAYIVICNLTNIHIQEFSEENYPLTSDIIDLLLGIRYKQEEIRNSYERIKPEHTQIINQKKIKQIIKAYTEKLQAKEEAEKSPTTQPWNMPLL